MGEYFCDIFGITYVFSIGQEHGDQFLCSLVDCKTLSLTLSIREDKNEMS